MGAARAQSSFGFSFPAAFPTKLSWELAGLGLNFPAGQQVGTGTFPGNTVAFQPGKGILGGAAFRDTVLDFCTRAVTIPAAFHTLEAAPVDNSPALPKKCCDSNSSPGKNKRSPDSPLFFHFPFGAFNPRLISLPLHVHIPPNMLLLPLHPFGARTLGYI